MWTSCYFINMQTDKQVNNWSMYTFMYYSRQHEDHALMTSLSPGKNVTSTTGATSYVVKAKTTDTRTSVGSKLPSVYHKAQWKSKGNYFLH